MFASVFRFFSVFVLLLSFCPSLVWLPFVVLFLALFVLVSLGVFVVVFLSLTDEEIKRKGAPVWCVLSCPVICV